MCLLDFPCMDLQVKKGIYFVRHIYTSIFTYALIHVCYITQLGLQQYCFLVFLAICSLMATYIFFVIPETKNKTFLEIQNEFQSSKKRNNSHADGISTTLLSSSV